MHTNYQYTTIMGTQFQNHTSLLRSFYAREDFARALRRVLKADKTGFHFYKYHLEQMCNARGIDCDALIQNDALLKQIPTRQELTGQLLEVFHSLFDHCPSPAAYMERIVRRLTPEYESDTLRTAILKKFILGGGADFSTYNTKPIIAWALDKMSPQLRETYAMASATEGLALIVDALDDSIFTPQRLHSELTGKETIAVMLRRWELLEENIGSLQSQGFFADSGKSGLTQLRNFCRGQGIDFATEDNEQTLGEKIMSHMSRFCQDNRFPSAGVEFIETLHSILRALLEQPTDGIPEPQMAYVSSCFWLLMRRTFYTNKNGQTATADNLFRTDIRDARNRKANGEWDLLKLCDDLAAGNFKTNNGYTRIWLYRFGIMFSMTAALQYGDTPDPERDIIKNLFLDYYCDNMARYLNTDPSVASSQEREPGGEGVNPKNFAEAIYLYYLHRQDLDLTPGQRIDHAEKRINACIARAKKGSTPPPAIDRHNYTYVYEQTLINKILCVDENGLVDAIMANYHVSAQSNGQILQSSDTNTAFGILMEAYQAFEQGDLYEGSAPSDSEGQREGKERIGQLIRDTRYTSDHRFHWKLAPLLLEQYRDDEAFCRVVTNIKQRLSIELNLSRSRRINSFSNLLHTLYFQASKEQPMKLKTLRDILFPNEVTLTEGTILEYIETLNRFGFDLKVTDRQTCYLGQTVYEDELLNQIMERIKVKYRYHEPAEQNARHQLMDQLLHRHESENRKVTRTTLIAVLTFRYISSIQDRRDLNTLPEIYEDFVTTMNLDLIECRFQPLNEKNMLDMFVILSVYLYLIEEGKGDCF